MSIKTQAFRAVASVAITSILVVISAACGDTEANQSGEAFWGPLRLEGDEVEGYATLDEMAAAADAVVRGNIADFGFSREIHGDAVEDVVTYGAMWFEPTEVLRGAIDPPPLPIEFIVNSPPDEAKATIEEQGRAIPDEEIIVFLREKGGEEAGLYRLVNSVGLWAAADGRVVAPLREEQEPEELPYQAELRDVTTLDDLAELIANGS